MTRNWLATAIALIVSIPLIPPLERGVRQLTGADAPRILPGKGWFAQVDQTRSVQPPDLVLLRNRAKEIGQLSSSAVRSFTVDLAWDSGSTPNKGKTAVYPVIADGGNWKTTILLVNTSEVPAQFEIRFIANNDGKDEEFTLTPSALAGQEVGWLLVSGPGILLVTSESTPPTIHSLASSEVISRLRDITWSKAILTILVLYDLPPLLAYLLVVIALRYLAFKALSILPRSVRRHASRDVNVMLGVAQWAGVTCYVVFAVKDILIGVAIIPAK